MDERSRNFMRKMEKIIKISYIILEIKLIKKGTGKEKHLSEFV